MPGLPGSAHDGTPNMNFLAVNIWGNAHSLDSPPLRYFICVTIDVLTACSQITTETAGLYAITPAASIATAR